jgi:glycine betaine/choline ABC-type transport system substrate-binding protein
MKRFLPLVVAFLLLFSRAEACTNFPINVGVVDTPEGRIIAQVVSVLINERTGVTVGLKYFKSSREMYRKVDEGKLEILIEDTSNALRFMNRPVSADPMANLAAVKALYKKRHGKRNVYFWLKPFAFTRTGPDGVPTLTAFLISRKAIDEFPALPRVVGKLSRLIDDAALARMVRDLAAKKDAKAIARKFLVKQKLI